MGRSPETTDDQPRFDTDEGRSVEAKHYMLGCIERPVAATALVMRVDEAVIWSSERSCRSSNVSATGRTCVGNGSTGIFPGAGGTDRDAPL